VLQFYCNNITYFPYSRNIRNNKILPSVWGYGENAWCWSISIETCSIKKREIRICFAGRDCVYFYSALRRSLTTTTTTMTTIYAFSFFLVEWRILVVTACAMYYMYSEYTLFVRRCFLNCSAYVLNEMTDARTVKHKIGQSLTSWEEEINKAGNCRYKMGWNTSGYLI
jgi:hypothetical protein